MQASEAGMIFAGKKKMHMCVHVRLKQSNQQQLHSCCQNAACDHAGK